MNNNFFHNLNVDILTPEFKLEILTFSKKNLDKFNAYKSMYTRLPDGNNYYKGTFLDLHSEIKNLKHRISLKFFPIIMLHYPNTTVKKHVDDPNKRNCLLSCPIYPKFNYAPTFFYTNPKNILDIANSELAAIANFDKGYPVLLNTQEVHGLWSGNDFRINLQLCFEERFDIVKGKIITDKFYI